MPQHQSIFSKQEMEFLQDQQFLLTKNDIARKIETLLGEVEQKLYPQIHQLQWPDGVLIKSGKISRGELYRGLPYFVLDYPRKFKKEGVFSFRTMCWWGNFFSGTWQISGKYLDPVRPKLLKNLASIRSSEVFVCVNSQPWDYHYQPDNYERGGDLTTEKLHTIFENHPFVKLSYRWDLEDYDSLPDLASTAFGQTYSWFTD